MKPKSRQEAKRNEGNIRYIIYLIVGFLLGFNFAILFICKFNFSIDSTISLGINPFEIISVIITIILALYITNVLEKNNSIHDKELEIMKSFFIEYLDDLKNRTDKMITNSKCDLNLMNSNCKFIRKRIYNIESQLHNINFDIKSKAYVSLKQNIKRYWEEFTMTNESTSAVNNNIRFFSNQEISVIENLVIEIERDIFEIIFEVNKC